MDKAMKVFFFSVGAGLGAGLSNGHEKSPVAASIIEQQTKNWIIKIFSLSFLAAIFDLARSYGKDIF